MNAPISLDLLCELNNCSTNCLKSRTDIIQKFSNYPKKRNEDKFRIKILVVIFNTSKLLRILSIVRFLYWLVHHMQHQAKSLAAMMLMTDSSLFKLLWSDHLDLITVVVQSSHLIRSCVLLTVSKVMIIGQLAQDQLLTTINDKERIAFNYNKGYILYIINWIWLLEMFDIIKLQCMYSIY